MRLLLGCVSWTLVLSLVASPASASQCPVLIKQGRDAAATMNPNDTKVKDARAKLDRASSLHKEGKHTEAMREANEALGLLGVQK